MPLSKTDKAQSEVIGIVILLSISILGISMILYLGQGTIGNAQGGVQQQQMTNELSLLSSQMATSALGPSQQQSAEIDLRGGELVSDPDGTVMNVTYTNEDNPSDSFTEAIEIGSVEYEGKDYTLGYEGGGVWRKTTGENESAMVSTPEFHYEKNTMTLPVFNITSEKTISGDRDSVRARSGETDVVLPNESRVPTPLPAGNVTVKIEGSEFYKAWGDYFEDRTKGINVKTHDQNQTAEMTLPTPETGDIEEAILGQDPSSGEGTGLKMDIDGGYIDSYGGNEHTEGSHNSDCGATYGGPENRGAKVTIPGELEMDSDSGDMCVYGDLSVGRTAVIDDATYISGDLLTGASGQSNQGDAEIGDNVHIGGDLDAHGSVEIGQPTTIEGDVSTTDIKQFEDGSVIEGDVRLTGNGQVLSCESNAEIQGTVYTDGKTNNANCDILGGVQPLGVSNPVETEDIDSSKHEMGNFPTSYENEKGLGEGSNDDICTKLEGNDLGSTCRIEESGGYYLTSMNMAGGELIIDSGTDVEISVAGDTDIDGSCIEVQGSLTLHLDSDADLDMQNLDMTGDGCTGSGDPHDATRTIINMHSNNNNGFGAGDVSLDNVDYTGVMMAPHTKDPDVQESEVYGALILGSDANPDNTNVHYHEALQGLQFNTGVSEVYFLHMTENRILVE